LLLERLAAVVQTKTIDNEVNEMTKFHSRFKKKLSVTKKKLEMQKITEENQRLLKRIQEVPPAYNHLEWEEQAKLAEKHKRSMALYPEFYDKLEKEEAMKKSGSPQRTRSTMRGSASGMGTAGGGGMGMGTAGGGGTGEFSVFPASASPGGFRTASSEGVAGRKLPPIKPKSFS
jgi:Hemingway/CFA97